MQRALCEGMRYKQLLVLLLVLLLLLVLSSPSSTVAIVWHAVRVLLFPFSPSLRL
jgi:hypothetical protein